ncbi:site-specific integrase [Vibrio alfacsensis]|uniref:site-specific integrase n=1 Tax=Vibrio alfacsensis TaxID=1074311 RepID=UPI004067FDF7
MSWIEYAQRGEIQGKVVYFWQPMPKALNGVFQAWCSENAASFSLTKQQKAALYHRLTRKKWRTPKSLRNQQVLRKDHFFSYLAHQANIDPYLSTPAASIIGSNSHHTSALSYQKRNTNQLRYEIFTAQNRYLERMVHVIQVSPFKSMCAVCLPSNQTLIHVLSQPVKVPAYLETTGAIVAFTRKMSEGTRHYVEIPAVEFGSNRALSVDDVMTFFHDLRQKLARVPKVSAGDAVLRQYFNQRTFELALLFVLLTGTRPNHHASIEGRGCYAYEHALIRDKGRHRTIEIGTYLQQAMESYQRLQAQCFSRLDVLETKLDLLWALIDESHQITPVTAKSLRLFMAEQWQQCFGDSRGPVVPYMLRHTFAQHALMSSKPKLTRQEIDLLMGHSEDGEHLGQAYYFAGVSERLTEHLNRWSELLQLTPIK